MNEMTESLLAYGGLVLFTVVFLEQAGLPLASAPWLLAASALSGSPQGRPAQGDGGPSAAAGDDDEPEVDR